MTASESDCNTRKGKSDDLPVKYGELKKKSPIRSLHFRTWTYFFLLAAIILIVLWGFQYLFYKASYSAMKKQDMLRLGDKVSDRYPGHAGDKEFNDYLRQMAHSNGLNIVIFHTGEECSVCSIENVDFKVEYVSSQFNADELPDKGLIAVDDPRIIDGWEEFFVKLKENDECCFTSSTDRGKYIFYGAHLGGSKYLYMTTPMQAAEGTKTIMNTQMLVSSLLCLVLSIVVSFFISERIAKPIVAFSHTAKKLGEGDYTVRFEGSGCNEIDNLADTLNTAAEEIGKTEQLRRDFLANVSHDLRTPLTMVKAYAEMIRDISGSDEVKRNQHSQVIIDEADRLTGLVNDILNLSKLQSGTEEFKLTEFDMSALVKIVIERFDMYSERDGYVFRVESDGVCKALGDFDRIEQVIYNLVGNAVSHAGDDKVVRIEVKNKGDKVRVSVRDFGSGIAPEEIDKVWERYYRASQTKRNVVGSGLGLSIVKGILDVHHAQFGVDSKLGEGTEFWFELASPKTEQLPPPKQHVKKSRAKSV